MLDLYFNGKSDYSENKFKNKERFCDIFFFADFKL